MVTGSTALRQKQNQYASSPRKWKELSQAHWQRKQKYRDAAKHKRKRWLLQRNKQHQQQQQQQHDGGSDQHHQHYQQQHGSGARGTVATVRASLARSNSGGEGGGSAVVAGGGGGVVRAQRTGSWGQRARNQAREEALDEPGAAALCATADDAGGGDGDDDCGDGGDAHANGGGNDNDNDPVWSLLSEVAGQLAKVAGSPPRVATTTISRTSSEQL